jgi:hypothetical protein
VLNARYWFADGSYFEMLRPPLAPAMIGIFSVFSWRASEYMLIIASSLIYLHAMRRLAMATRLDAKLFYMMSLTPYFVLTATVDGTELLGLALFTEFLASALSKGRKAGSHFLGLAMLARYNFIPYAAFILLYKPKQWLREAVLLITTIAPWLAYNYIKYGNALASVLDNRYMNFTSRAYMHQPISIMHLIIAINILIPLFMYGICISIRTILENSKDKERKPKTSGTINKAKKWVQLPIKIDKITISMLAVMAITVAMYAMTPQKQVRYLFNLVLPVAYFSTIGLQRMSVKAARFSELALLWMKALPAIMNCR